MSAQHPIAASTTLSTTALGAIGVPVTASRNTIASIDALAAATQIMLQGTNKAKRSASPKNTTSWKKQKSVTSDAELE